MSVAIDGHDPPARPEQVGEGQRERPLPAPMSAHVPPGSTAGAEQADVVGVVHRLAGVLEPGRDAVDGQLDEAQDALALRVVGRQRAQPGEQPDLELGQRVDVRVAQRDRALEDRRPVEQPLAPGDPRRSATVRRYSVSIASQRRSSPGPVASAGVQPGDPHVGLGQAHLGVVEQARQERPVARRAGRVASSPASPWARRYASSACPRPYQPGRLSRDCDQANTHGIARSESIDGRLVAPPARRRPRPEPQGRQLVDRA